jgi:hypothetical protein
MIKLHVWQYVVIVLTSDIIMWSMGYHTAKIEEWKKQDKDVLKCSEDAVHIIEDSVQEKGYK